MACNRIECLPSGVEDELVEPAGLWCGVLPVAVLPRVSLRRRASSLPHCRVTMAKSLAELRQLDRSQISRITKDDLINAILTPVSTDNASIEGKLAELIAEIREQRTEIRELKQSFADTEARLNSRINDLESQAKVRDDLLKNQQDFCESVDRELRETKLVILGVPDENESLDGATTEDTKLAKVWDAVGESPVVVSHKRLGRPDGQRRRPILVKVTTGAERDNILSKSRRLKEDGRDEVKKIFIKRDEHPAIRREWNRLRAVVRSELAKPENSGCNIRLDVKQRKVYKDESVIDSWRMFSF